jgi:hypothetical protein
MALAADPIPQTIIKPVSRRWVLGGLVAAPAIVAASNIMPVRPMEWIGDQHIVLICGGPNPFGDTVAHWERHLAMLKTLPDNTWFKAEMIENAEWIIAWEKGGGQMPTGKW